LFLLGGEGLG